MTTWRSQLNIVDQ